MFLMLCKFCYIHFSHIKIQHGNKPVFSITRNWGKCRFSICNPNLFIISVSETQSQSWSTFEASRVRGYRNLGNYLHAVVKNPNKRGSALRFNCSQFVVARGSQMYLFYKRNTAQGHRRRLLPLHLWCIINRKTDPESSTLHLSLSFPPSSFLPSFLSLIFLLSLPTFALSLKSNI